MNIIDVVPIMYMETMASTSHGLSVWANTCVKCPVNPKTGLSATLHDKMTHIRCDNVFSGNEGTSDVGLSNTTNLLGPDTTNGDILLDEMLMSKGDQFYVKLKQLKEENMKTLKAFESLYRDKMLTESVRKSESFEFDPDIKVEDNSTGISLKKEDTYTVTTVSKPEDTIVSKPPSGKTRESILYMPIPSEKIPQISTQRSKLDRPTSAPMERSQSLDSEFWHQAYFRSKDSNENFIIPQEDNSRKYEKALAKVDKLWEDFKISEHSQRRHSFSSSRNKNKRQSDNAKTEWRHRLTIPHPFRMSIREALKETKKTSAQEELEQRRLAKQKQEEAECEKKFKANPVPAHVYLPKYADIMEKNETRRKYVKHICQELLQSQVKPFKFDAREKEKKLQRAYSAPIRKSEITSSTFKARPVPRHVFSPDIDQKLLEEEQLRKIKVKMRSKELLKASTLPPNMAAREKLRDQERKEKLKVAKLAAKKRHKENVHGILDYHALYNEFKKEFERRRFMQTGMDVEPFHKATASNNSSKNKIIKDDETRLQENQKHLQSSNVAPHSSIKYLGALSSSLDYIPAQTTRSAELRSTMIKKEKERLFNRQKEEEEAEKRRKAREEKLRSYLSETTNSTDILKPRDSVAERLKRMRKDDMERQEAYEREIEEMHTRVEKSPLLVEKFMKENAKTAADKKFIATLQKSGLDDKEFVSTKSLKHASIKSDVNSNNHLPDDATASPHIGNLTYTKSATDN